MLKDLNTDLADAREFNLGFLAAMAKGANRVTVAIQAEKAVIVRAVLLEHSASSRQSFAALKRAARNFKPTRYYATAPAAWQGRSGVGDFTLNDGESEGWQVCSFGVAEMAGNLQCFVVDCGVKLESQQAVPAPARPAASAPKKAVKALIPEAATPKDAKAEVVKLYHTRRKHDIFQVTWHKKVSRTVFMELLSAAKAKGGRYARAYQGNPHGFYFDSRQLAATFMAENF